MCVCQMILKKKHLIVDLKILENLIFDFFFFFSIIISYLTTKFVTQINITILLKYEI